MHMHTHTQHRTTCPSARTYADACKRTLATSTHIRTIPRASLTRGARRSVEHIHVIGRSSAPAVARVEACTPLHPLCPGAAPTGVTSLHLCGSGHTLRAQVPALHGGGTLAFARTRAVPRGAPTRARPFPHSAQDYLAGRRTPEVAGLARPTGRVTRPMAVTANAAHPASCAQQHAARSYHMFGSPSVRWEGPRPCAALRAGRHHCPRRYPLFLRRAS